MRCDDVMVNLPDYLLGKVEPNFKKYIENHLEACAKCKAELEAMRVPIKALEGVGIEEYPDAFWQELRALIMEKISEPHPARWRVPALASGLAVFLLIIGVGVYEFALKPAPQVQSVAALATSLPLDQAVTLPTLNVNYVDAASPQVDEVDEINSVDDSVQEEVVKSMWVSVADSSKSLDNFDFTGNSISN